MLVSPTALLPILALATSISAQTYSQCNPLINPGTCPPNPALGKGTSINFQSASDSFTQHGTVQYSSDGAQFTVAQSGDNPTISSKWYIMFGHVEFVVKAAPGQGIVSSAVLMSDCLDEIDWEWLGGDDDQVQSNYFRKGQTVTGYNRGAFHSAPGTHDNFHTYTIDWTADQIVWSIDGNTVRVLEATNAENGDYPQTPMQIKLGSWAGGDSGNPAGTIEWAGGLTDYTQGPFTMYVKSIAVTDYSTGNSYSYSGIEGSWESIQSDGGQVNPQGNGRPASADSAPPVTSTVPNDSPLAFDPHDSASVYATRTGWPWDGTATASVVPAGWTVDGNGNLQPPSSGAMPSPSLSSPPVSSSASASDPGPDDGPFAAITTDSTAASSPLAPSRNSIKPPSTPKGPTFFSSVTSSIDSTSSQSVPLQGSLMPPGTSTIATGQVAAPESASVMASSSQPTDTLSISVPLSSRPASATNPPSSGATLFRSESASAATLTTASETRSMSTTTIRDSSTTSDSSSTGARESPTETPPAPANRGSRQSSFPAMVAVIVAGIAVAW